MAELYRYAAFISYSSKDVAFARRLHRALENYVIPKSLGETDLVGSGKKSRVYPVCLDRDEFAAGHLAEEIEAKLRASAALIIVCSPNAAASPWVQREIEYFVGLGRRNRIFAIIASNAPVKDEGGADCTASCFPPGFNGDALADVAALEPLAADARKGKDGFRNAWLKVVAGLAGISPGALRDRDRARVLRRNLFVAGTAVAGVMLLALAGAAVDAARWRSDFSGAAQSKISATAFLEAMPLAIAGLPERGSVIGASHPNAHTVALQTGASLPVVRQFVQTGSVGEHMFSPNGRFIISFDGAVDTLHDLQGPNSFDLGGNNRSFLFSPDSRYVLTQNNDGEGHVRDLQTLRVASVGWIKDRRLGVESFAFSDNGRWLAIVSRENEIILHDLNSSAVPPTRLGRGEAPQFAAGSRHLLMRTDNGGRLYDLARSLTEPALAFSRQTTNFLPHHSSDFSPDGRYLAWTEPGGQMHLRDLTGDQTTTALGRGYFSFSMYGGFLLTKADHRQAKLWRLGANSAPVPLGETLRYGFSPAQGFLVWQRPAPDNTWRLLGLNQTGVDIPLGRLETLGSHYFTPNDRWLITRNETDELTLRDLQQPAASIPLGRAAHYSISDDGRFLVLLASDRQFRVVDRNSGAVLVSDADTSNFHHSPDGRVLVRFGGNGTWIHNMLDPNRASFPLGDVKDVYFSADSRFLLTAYYDDVSAVRDAHRGDWQTDADWRARVCAASGDAFRPLPRAPDTGGAVAARGRLWNPCDWRGLLAIFPSQEHGDGWFEGARQWLRLMQVRFGGKDWECAESTSAASTQTRAARARMCQMLAPTRAT